MYAEVLATRSVLRPGDFDVIVGSSLLGGLLSEVTAAVLGAIGVAPSVNLNPEKRFPSLFEPIHGSAPDIAGQGAANPSGAIWAAAQMAPALLLEHAGYTEAGQRVLDMLEAAITGGTRTRDLGGAATTEEMTEAVVRKLLGAD